MNIFVSNLDPIKCASDHCITHQIKMISEYTQLLSTTVRIHTGTPLTIHQQTQQGTKIFEWRALPSDTVVKLNGKFKLAGSIVPASTHANHPCAIWTRASTQNYKWLLTLALELCNLYKVRTNKHHVYHDILKSAELIVPDSLPKNGLTTHPICGEAPADLDIVDSYKHILNNKYAAWSKTTRPGAPKWHNNEVPTWVKY